MSVRIAGNDALEVPTRQFQLLSSVWAIVIACVWIVFLMAYGWTADKLDSAQNSTSITNYAVQVSGLHSEDKEGDPTVFQ